MKKHISGYQINEHNHRPGDVIGNSMHVIQFAYFRAKDKRELCQIVIQSYEKYTKNMIIYSTE